MSISERLQSYGPAFFIIDYLIGIGSVTSMVVSCTNYGLSLLWALLFSCVFTYFLLVGIGTLTMVSVENLIHIFKKFFGRPVTIFIIAALLVYIRSYCIEMMGVVAKLDLEWISFRISVSVLNSAIIAIFFIMPLMTLFALILLNRSSTRKGYRINIGTNITLGATLTFNCNMLSVAFKRFLNLL